MTIAITADNTVLVLYPPIVKGQTTAVAPVDLADIGVPLVAYDLVTDGNGAHVDVDPPRSGEMLARDVMKLWLEGEGAVLDSVIIVEPDAVTPLRIPTGRLHQDLVNHLFYTIERNSQNIGTSTMLRILYNRIRPGLKDRYDSPGGHSELKLDLAELIRNGVGPGFVSAQASATYPYCRAYDRITLKCNGELMYVNVTKDQAPQPPNPGSEAPITIGFTITRAYLEKAKREDQQLIFSYTVTDQIGNGPDTDAPWSPPQTVAEDLDGKLLAKAIMREIEGDTTDDPEIIDLEKLANNDLTLAIPTGDPRFQVGDKIDALYTATRIGFPDIVERLSGTVEEGDFEPKRTCILKVPNAKVIAGSSVTVTYELRRPNSDLVGSSNPARAQVTGTHLELKPPSILQANGNTLPPMAAVSRLTIIVPPGSKLPSDLLSVFWTAKPGTHVEGSITTPPRPISESGLNIEIPPPVLAFCLGDSVTVGYVITRDGQTMPSQPLTLNVQDLPQAELIAPRLKQATSGGEGAELKLTDLTPDGKMWVPGFPFNTTGQFVWLLFKGTNEDSSPYERYVWAAPLAFVNDDWVKNGYFEATAPYEDLKNLKKGTNLTIEMRVAFGKSESLALSKPFSVRTYTVSAVEDVAPTITSVKSSPSDKEIIRDGTTVETAVNLAGVAARRQQVEVFDNLDSQGVREVDDEGLWQHYIDGLVPGKHTLSVRAKYGSLPVSDSYGFEVLRPFTIDTTLMELKGLNINADFLALTGTPVPGTTQTRVPTTGDGGYSYSSSAPDVVTVNGNGLVSGLKNGSANITVKENRTQRNVSFPVKVENVLRLVMTPTHTYSIGAALNWMNSIQGSGVSDAAINVLKIKYRPLVSSAGGWLCRNDGCGAGQYLCVMTNNATVWNIACFTGNNTQAHGWCLVNS